MGADYVNAKKTFWISRMFLDGSVCGTNAIPNTRKIQEEPFEEYESTTKATGA
jgi:hypothetical protein